MTITYKQKVKNYIDLNIIPAIRQGDLDYNKIIKLICSETEASINVIENIFQQYFMLDKIKEIRILTIPDKELMPLLKEQAKTRKEISKEVKDVLEVKK